MTSLSDLPPKCPKLPTVTENEVQGFDLRNTGSLLNFDARLIVILVEVVDFEITWNRIRILVICGNTLKSRSLKAKGRGSAHGWSGHGDSLVQEVDFP